MLRSTAALFEMTVIPYNIFAMTTREIMRALRNNKCVVLSHEPWQWIRRDLFGDLVVVDVRHNDEPIRKATLSDKRQATIQGTTMPIKKH